MIGTIVSHYRIIEKLGGGGMGIVYKAEDTKLRRTVALKFLPPTFSADAEARQRFMREAQAASALQHNNICTIHDIDETADGQFFIVMDCYEGETLKEKIERGPLAIDTITDYALQIAQGLAEAHEHGIVHRDIKPANILITNAGVAKLLDFGLAKLQGESKVTRTDSMAGTVAYMSPEQVLGQESDHRTDIWSFGVLLFEMLAGYLPFKGEMSAAIMYGITNLEPEPFNDDRRAIPDDLKDLTLVCLRKDRNERPQSFHDVVVRITGGNNATYHRKASKRIPDRSRILIGSLILVLAIGIYVVTRYDFFASTQTPQAADIVLVTDFQNKTDQGVFDYSLSKAMIVSLQQSKHVRLLARERVVYALQLLKMPADKPLDVTTALAVAKREGVRMVIAGAITSLGTTYVLTLEIIDGATGATVDLLRRNAGRIEDIIPALGDLCNDLRSKLGESFSQISKASRPLADVTSSSLEALQLYSRSDQYQSVGKYAESAVLLEKAVSIDSLFTMAISDLSLAYRKTGYDSLALVYHRRVLPLIGRVTDRERAIVLGLYYGPFFELEYQQAYESMQAGLVLAPDDPTILTTVGHLAMTVGDTKAVLRANEEAIAIAPDWAGTCYNNSGYALAQDQRYEEALENFSKSKSLRPEFLSIDMYIAKVHWMKGNLDSAMKTLQSLLPINDPYPANQVHTILASLYYYQGQIKRSKAECLSALSSTRLLKRPMDQSYFRYLLAEIALEEGDRKEYYRQIQKSISTSTSPYFELGLAGASLARNGLVDDAEKVLSTIAAVKSDDPYFTKRRSAFENLTKGEIELSRRNFAKAKEHFEAVERRHASDILFWLGQKGLALSMIQLGDTAATSVLQNILSRKGEVIMGTLTAVRFAGFWTLWLLPDVQVDLAKLFIKEGKREKAKYELMQCVQLWSKADKSFTRAQNAGFLLSQIDSLKPVNIQ